MSEVCLTIQRAPVYDASTQEKAPESQISPSRGEESYSTHATFEFFNSYINGWTAHLERLKTMNYNPRIDTKYEPATADALQTTRNTVTQVWKEFKSKIDTIPDNTLLIRKDAVDTTTLYKIFAAARIDDHYHPSTSTKCLEKLPYSMVGYRETKEIAYIALNGSVLKETLRNTDVYSFFDYVKVERFETRLTSVRKKNKLISTALRQTEMEKLQALQKANLSTNTTPPPQFDCTPVTITEQSLNRYAEICIKNLININYIDGDSLLAW